MAKTQDLKRRIRSIRNTMQLTRAMKMVAASKLRRAQERIVKARPYSRHVLRVLRSLAARANPELHPLLRVDGRNRMELIVVTSDRGLCGAFNAGIIRAAEAFAAAEASRSPAISAVGRKGRDHFARRHELSRQWTDVFRIVEFATAKAIADDIMERFVRDEVDAFFLVYNEFKSAIQCRPVVQQLLPIERAELEGGGAPEDYIYEPSAQALFDAILPHYVETQVFHAMLESVAAEQAARMTAMDSATKNAGELIENLTLTMNRVRQASITTEIIEVVSGAEALG
jgi:F-type H+-transporting ATPase subunit gamma